MLMYFKLNESKLRIIVIYEASVYTNCWSTELSSYSGANVSLCVNRTVASPDVFCQRFNCYKYFERLKPTLGGVSIHGLPVEVAATVSRSLSNSDWTVPSLSHLTAHTSSTSSLTLGLTCSTANAKRYFYG